MNISYLTSKKILRKCSCFPEQRYQFCHAVLISSHFMMHLVFLWQIVLQSMNFSKRQCSVKLRSNIQSWLFSSLVIALTVKKLQTSIKLWRIRAHWVEWQTTIICRTNLLKTWQITFRFQSSNLFSRHKCLLTTVVKELLYQCSYLGHSIPLNHVYKTLSLNLQNFPFSAFKGLEGLAI